MPGRNIDSATSHARLSCPSGTPIERAPFTRPGRIPPPLRLSSCRLSFRFMPLSRRIRRPFPSFRVPLSLAARSYSRYLFMFSFRTSPSFPSRPLHCSLVPPSSRFLLYFLSKSSNSYARVGPRAAHPLPPPRPVARAGGLRGQPTPPSL